ncbi:UDP-N-acetylglucosamine-dolichyl-phosphate N-acetylglucosaminephosphotransferase [Gigaspora margarita]|uniref:UDP-N-acetylglucosamine--dolichyl-phosphate N-acetylglucosaminephosphotransferase n=2 Tax=Gigaspora margarita TaxID=4874 RepID=A0A8H4AAV1_GIGMA|nr:UDP-N-acetylglucosamine-dolichyl-phosphate N-acetylglucosaminephosphotransferase [Gigaspora margarita]
MLTTTASLTLTSVILLALVIILNTVHDPLSASIGFSILGCAITWRLVPALKDSFLKANLAGKDLNKLDKQIIPESMGVVCATVYLVCLFLFIPFPFMEWFTGKGIISRTEEFHAPTFPHHKLGEFLSAMLSLQSMTFLGFADDVFDIRWRYKLLLPTIASIPLLMVYYVNFGETHIIMPIPLRFLLGRVVDLGVLYYVYMGMVAVFCTNSINILAGINGVEIGQSLVIACSIAINDYLFLNGSSPAVEAHLFSLYFILPFIGVSLGLIMHNWYPSRVFVGDTYCYFAGMTFTVVGILAHFSKTLLLFFIPQIFNFIYSAPQLFKLIDCPRHRMPKFNPTTQKLNYSRVHMQKPLGISAFVILKIFSSLGLVEITELENSIEVNNFTLLNLLLLKLGPMNERTLTIVVIIIQIFTSCIAFIIRYRLVHLFYEVII